LITSALANNLESGQKRRSFDLFDCLLFIFFFTQHADLLSFICGGLVIRLVNAFAAITLTIFLIYKRRQLFAFDRGLLLSVAILTLSILLSALFSDYRLRTSLFLARWCVELIFYFIFPYLLMRQYGSKKVLRIYFSVFLVVGCYALLQFLFSLVGVRDPFAKQSFYGHIVRADAFSSEPSFYALYMTPFVIFTSTLFLLQKPDRKRVYFLLFVNILFFVSTATSALFTYLIYFPLVWLFCKQQRRAIYSYLSAFMAALVILAIALPKFSKLFFFKFFNTDFSSHHSFLERWVGMVNGWKIFLSQPFFGVGLGAYPHYLFRRWLEADARYTFLNSAETINALSYPYKAFEPMNTLSEIGASLGILGLFAFGLFFFSFYKAFRRAARNKMNLAFFISALVMLIVLQFNQGLFRCYLWSYLAIAWGYFSNQDRSLGRAITN